MESDLPCIVAWIDGEEEKKMKIMKSKKKNELWTKNMKGKHKDD